MTKTTTRRQPSGKPAGGGMSGRNQMPTLEKRDTAVTVPDPDEKVEVVLEPDLPIEEPAVSPAGPVDAPSEDAPDLEDELDAPSVDPKRAYYDQLLAQMPQDEPVYVAGNRAPRLKVGEYTLQPGDIVPGAHHWPRREAYERLGRIERR